MPENTPNLNLYKVNPATDGNDTFNIDTMLNANWDRVDQHAGDTVKHVTAAERTTWNDKETTAGAQAKANAAAAASVPLIDYVRSPGFGIDSGTANAKTLTLTPAITSYVGGMGFVFVNAVENTGAVTVNVSGVGNVQLLDSKGSALSPGKLKAGVIYTIRYNGSAFILQGEGGGVVPKLPNLIKYGSFENTGAASGAVYSNEQAKFGSYSLAIACPTGQLESTVTMGDLVTITAAHQYYISVWAYSATAGVSVQAYARMAEPSVTATLDTANTWTFISGILSFASSSTSYPRLDNNTPNTTIYYDGFMLIDLTDAYGAGNEPSLSEVDEMVKKYGGWWDTDLALLTANATATADDIVANKTAYKNGAKLTGTITDYRATNFPGYAAVNTAPGVMLVAPDIAIGSQVVNAASGLITDMNSYINPANIMAGKSIMQISGSATSDSNASATDIASGKTAYVNGVKRTGTLVVPVTSSGSFSTSGGVTIASPTVLYNWFGNMPNNSFGYVIFKLSTDTNAGDVCIYGIGKDSSGTLYLSVIFEKMSRITAFDINYKTFTSLVAGTYYFRSILLT
ncbi:hypothetical protein KIH86_17595 [Paenibacillus sp. HN-1]|uniref:hypothetical protein n=1 Tax=Paenibacillus TaxID=44249 RepID=UPI001CA9D163|nr:MULTISPECIES: hypothetical protein [Paenibacillus]MBY9078317.1 hypothetical protein [Paenibacillus sp. CGMCC 1.18879]MBY9086024.1 hypothetical protein [Paenibacillus sinensis]